MPARRTAKYAPSKEFLSQFSPEVQEGIQKAVKSAQAPVRWAAYKTMGGKVFHPSCIRKDGGQNVVETGHRYWPVGKKCGWCGKGARG